MLSSREQPSLPWCESLPGAAGVYATKANASSTTPILSLVPCSARFLALLGKPRLFTNAVCSYPGWSTEQLHGAIKAGWVKP